MPQSALQTEWGNYFSKGQWRYWRNSFSAAGQDSWTAPPAQNPDLFEKLTNILPPLQGDLQRRWGYTALNTSGAVNQAPIGRVAASLYYNQTSNSRYVILPTYPNLPPLPGGRVVALNEDGSTYNTGIFQTSGFAGLHQCPSRSYAYFASGVPADLQKWNGASTGTQGGGVTNWGITAPSGGSGGGTATAGIGASVGSSDFSWSNPSDITGSSGYATVGLFDASNTSQRLQATNFGFSLGSSTVISEVVATVHAHSGISSNVMVYAQLLGVTSGTLTSGPMTPTAADLTFTFSVSATAAQVNSSGFGVAFWIVYPGGGGEAFFLQNARVSLNVPGQPTVTTGSSGNITLVSGRTYFTVYQNSTTGHLSDLSIASNSSGPVSNVQLDLSNIPTSSDPQVDSVVILATSDGGDQTLLYYAGQVANGTTTFTDNLPDTSLVLGNVYLETDEYGDTIGVADNTPPPNTLQFPILHRGRMYGATNQYLYYSKADSDLLTTTGFLAGKFEESWPALNCFVITSEADVITGLLSDGQVLYVGTTKKVVRLFGDGPENYTEPVALFTDTGVLNQDVWQMVFSEGNPVGAMWLTPDCRVIGSDFNTYQDLGEPVQDILNSINQNAAQAAWATYCAQGIYSLYLLAVPTGANTTPDTILAFDLKARQWFVWQFADNFVGGVWNVTQSGAPTTYLIAASGNVYKLDPSQTQDRMGNNPVAISATIRTPWLSIVDPTARLYLNEIEISTGCPGLLTTVEGASTTAQFSRPNTVVSGFPLRTKPLGEYAVFLAGQTTKDRYYRFTFTDNSSNARILDSISVEGGVLHRL